MKGRCVECGKRTERLGPSPHASAVTTWVCADCEYLREKPDAPKVHRPGPGPGPGLFDRDEYAR